MQSNPSPRRTANYTTISRSSWPRLSMHMCVTRPQWVNGFDTPLELSDDDLAGSTPVSVPHKGPVMRKIGPCHEVIRLGFSLKIPRSREIQIMFYLSLSSLSGVPVCTLVQFQGDIDISSHNIETMRKCMSTHLTPYSPIVPTMIAVMAIPRMYFLNGLPRCCVPSWISKYISFLKVELGIVVPKIHQL